MKINYMKSNFVTTPPSNSFIERYFTKQRSVRLGVFREFSELKITLMRKDFSFVNVTGAKSMSTLKSFLSFYINQSRTNVLSQLKIDSIIGFHKFKKRSNIKFEDFRRSLSVKKLSVKDNSKFPGVTIRRNDLLKGSCCVYFRSGVVNFIGYKSIEEVFLILRIIESCLYSRI